MNYDNQKLKKLLESLGFSGQMNEAMISFLISKGATSKQLNEMLYEWLGTQGYSGQYSERCKKWFEDGFPTGGGVIDTWILKTGVWDDTGKWNDTSNWKDA